MPRIAFYCQKCGSGNAPGRDACFHCGTRLWLITEPPTARYEINHATPYEEHLLERISLLEHNIARLTERFERILELLLRQSHNSYLDHTLLESLIALLNGSEVIQNGTLSAIWHMRQTLDAAERNLQLRNEQRKQAILAQHKALDATSSETLAVALQETLPQIEENALTGARQLEKLLPLSPQNSALLYLIGECFYAARKPLLALEYLSSSVKLDARHGATQLLLGLLLGDQGEKQAVFATKYLEKSLQLMGENVPARYALGRLAAAQGRWEDAVKHFKNALAIKRHNQLLYALAYAYFMLNKHKIAQRFMQQILDNDATYAPAWYWLGYWAWQTGALSEARELFRTAAEAAPHEEFYRTLLPPVKKEKQAMVAVELKPFGISRRSKKIVSGGDPRLADFLHEAALEACRPTLETPAALLETFLASQPTSKAQR